MCSRIFAAWYSAAMIVTEPTLIRPLRTILLASARGDLLIVGLGPGHDLRHIPPGVTSVTAVEPNPAMRAVALRRAERLDTAVEIIDSVAESLPFPDDSFDTVLTSVVLCSVRDVSASLAQIRRVLRPGGELLVLEHVRAPDNTGYGKFQDFVAGPWSAFTDGCRPNRRTRAALLDAGFDTDMLGAGVLPVPGPISTFLIGRATVAADQVRQIRTTGT
ncbi:class I SAM-dependent methyltransferase [Nocardia sp. NPDC052112]|uniref:class I SAM-dependent methyltransferase n=1 Tax=Nocardia sp. NPDC052112 TaxID=3155646 RepID=UPI0034215D5C